jgi:hypothetical protein
MMAKHSETKKLEMKNTVNIYLKYSPSRAKEMKRQWKQL